MLSRSYGGRVCGDVACFLPVLTRYYQYHVWATRIAHWERLKGPVSRGIAKCHNLRHPGLDLVFGLEIRVLVSGFG